MQLASTSDEYALATGEAAVYRLTLLDSVHSSGTRQLLERAGLETGMRVADLGCGVGLVTRVLAEMVGPRGSVVGVDVSKDQLAQARKRVDAEGLTNVSFVQADVTHTGLPHNFFDLVYCRFLLMHLTRPEAALGEMHALLRPGGTLVCEDADLTAAESIPPSAINTFAELFRRLGPIKGVDYGITRRLYHLVTAAGFPDPNVYIYRLAFARGEAKSLPEMSLREASDAFIRAGLIGREELESTLAEMRRVSSDPNVLVLFPPATQVWARKV